MNGLSWLDFGPMIREGKNKRGEQMKALRIATLLIIASTAACGGGGDEASNEDIATVSFAGAYEGSLSRVSHKDDCEDRQPTFYNGFLVSHNMGERVLTIQQRRDSYSKNISGTVTSADSFVVEMEPVPAGVRRGCTSQTTITFEEINESSARVIETETRIGIKNCGSFDFSQEISGSCTRIYEGVLPRK